MRTSTSLLAALAVSIVALAPGPARALPNNWAFTTQVTLAPRPVASSAAGVDAMVFDVTATGAKLTRVTRMAFMVKGNVHTGQLANFQLVYYPTGLAGAGYVVGSSAGSTWTPAGGSSSIVNIDLAAPVVVQGDFAGVFAVRVDVNGTPASFFAPRLQTVTVDDGVVRNLVETEDLPLQGAELVLN